MRRAHRHCEANISIRVIGIAACLHYGNYNVSGIALNFTCSVLHRISIILCSQRYGMFLYLQQHFKFLSPGLNATWNSKHFHLSRSWYFARLKSPEWLSTVWVMSYLYKVQAQRSEWNVSWLRVCGRRRPQRRRAAPAVPLTPSHCYAVSKSSANGIYLCKLSCVALILRAIVQKCPLRVWNCRGSVASFTPKVVER